MERKFYRNYVWYNLTDDEYWVEEFPDKFPNCQTIIFHPKYCPQLATQSTDCFGWETMVKQGGWQFMIIEKP